ncbi:MAG: hypothetical protein MI685_07000 [Chlorobiales bacterium]|nr:hypothetical protein [Chlorobiales bacterium]
MIISINAMARAFFSTIVGFILLFSVACSEQEQQQEAEQQGEQQEQPQMQEEQPFGGDEDVAFADALWKEMEKSNLVGQSRIVDSEPYKGAPPHGMILDVSEQKITVNGIEGDLVVKRNYGGDGLTVEDVKNDPAKYLEAVTIMFKREDGYDDENRNWFYVKYGSDGTILTNPKGALLAGRVAKGAPTGCIACHKSAPGGDYLFIHDRFK